MPEAVSDRSPQAGPEKPNRRRLRALLRGLILVILTVAAASLLALEATEPLAEPQACTWCHEMQDAYDSWARSPHHVNPSGVKVTCISCHLPPREDHIAHLASKAWSGAKDAYVHFFGEYDAEAARRTVLQTMPSERCLNCHDNLLAMPSSSSVGIVHGAALEKIPSRDHACIACHDALHGPKAIEKACEAADNSYCYVCHLNFDGEEFVARHMAAGVGCTKCHGDSEKHADDEAHVVPPDVMYPEGKINASCTSDKCHLEAEMKKEIGHRPYYAGAHTEKEHCTDCHGEHRLDERQRKWDKVTRKLIWPENYTPTDGGMSGP